MIEDKVLDLVIIFESLHSTLAKLRKQCEAHCLGDACYECNCASIIDELEEQMHEAEVNLKKADVLHKRAQGTAQLVKLYSLQRVTSTHVLSYRTCSTMRTPRLPKSTKRLLMDS